MKISKVFFWNAEFVQNVKLMNHLLNKKIQDGCTPLALAKTVKTETKSYVTDIVGLWQSYISHTCNKCCLYLTNIVKLQSSLTIQSKSVGLGVDFVSPP